MPLQAKDESIAQLEQQLAAGTATPSATLSRISRSLRRGPEELLRSPAAPGVAMTAGVIVATTTGGSVYGAMRSLLPADKRLLMDVAAGLTAATALASIVSA